MTVVRTRWRSGLAALMLLALPAPSYAEWQVRPFVGLTFAASTNLFLFGAGDPDASSTLTPKNVAFGANGGFLGEVLGIEVDFSRAPGFFQPTDLLAESNVTTLTGNVVVALPRRMSEYTLRPYFVGGAGWMRPTTTEATAEFSFSRNMTAIDLGGGATGFLSRSVGLNWDLRHFRNVNGLVQSGTTTDGEAESVSYWRATMAIAFRY